jgi:hypothetical protein
MKDDVARSGMSEVEDKIDVANGASFLAKDRLPIAPQNGHPNPVRIVGIELDVSLSVLRQ